MNSSDVHLTVDYLGSNGVILTVEQKAALQSSLTILKNEQKFERVYLWGKIKGINDDYFIAQGVGMDELAERKTLYSKDCINWGLMPPATKEVKEKAALAKGRFTGTPAHEFEHTEIKKVPGEGDEIHEEEETVSIKEEDRLAAVVAEIDHDVAIVPRGSCIRTPIGQVITNRMFEGLTVEDSTKLSSYYHLREAEILPNKSLLERAKMDKAIDFLDTIEDDIPNGSWSIQFDRGNSLVVLRSLLWPGYVFYHVPETRKFGSMYFGIGEKNKDLPFML